MGDSSLPSYAKGKGDEANRDRQESTLKVSDATKRIEKRLAELHRHDGNEQSSITENGDSSDQPAEAAVTRLDGENANIGAQSVAQSGAKILQDFERDKSIAGN